MKITHNEMEYSIYRRADGKFDVLDVGGARPLGLRDVGPWSSESDAATAIRNMTSEESAE